ncbi:MAG: beta-ketoacyl-ACP synthase [Xanthobacteraceae bacterium]
MTDDRRETWITGLGIVSCLGEGPDAHWRRFNEAPPLPDASAFAPYIIHRMPPLEFDKQIPRKGDQRQMELWQRIGTYAAGLALDSAGAKGNAELLAGMDMIVAAGGGERDESVDTTILTGLPKAERPQSYLNERLMSDLRPTLFLAQLSNLLAGNISIVHGVTGSSRTFMGEEAAGVDAVRIALARVAGGQSNIILVGGSYNAERNDQILLYATGGHALKDRFVPVWERAARGGGIALGSIGAFLVLEERDHALARKAKPLARLSSVQSDRASRQAGSLMAALSRLWSGISSKLRPGRLAIISGASGAEPATSEERAWLETMPDIPMRATGTYLGHGFEPQFPLNIALATMALEHEKLPAPAVSSELERGMDGGLQQVVVTGVGHWRGEGMALVEAVR